MVLVVPVSTTALTPISRHIAHTCDALVVYCTFSFFFLSPVLVSFLRIIHILVEFLPSAAYLIDQEAFLLLVTDGKYHGKKPCEDNMSEEIKRSNRDADHCEGTRFLRDTSS